MMTKILSGDEKPAVLSSAYSEIVNDRNQMSMTTRAAARGEPTSVYAKSHAYYYNNNYNNNSFLPTKNPQRSKNSRSIALKVRLAKC